VYNYEEEEEEKKKKKVVILRYSLSLPLRRG
jgi:hypothetical protein